MNSIKKGSREMAAWRALLTLPEAGRLPELLLLFFVSLLVIPFASVEAIALIYLGLVSVFYYRLTARLSSLLLPALVGFLMYSLAGTLLLPAGFFAVTVGGAAGALLFALVAKWQYGVALAALPSLAYLLAFLLSRDPLSALLVLLPVSVAAVGGIAVRRLFTYKSAVLLIAASLGALLLTAGLITFLALGHGGANPLVTLADTLREGIVAATEEMRGMYAEMELPFPFSTEEVVLLAALVVNLLPAIFVICLLVTAYFAWRALLQMLLSFGVLPRLPLRLALLDVSPYAAVLFMLAYLVSLIAGGGGDVVVGAVASNLALILEPALSLVGGKLLLHPGEERSCLSFVLLIFTAYLLWTNPGVALVLLSFVGAIHILAVRISAARKNKGER